MRTTFSVHVVEDEEIDVAAEHVGGMGRVALWISEDPPPTEW
jgi:hypothetical protein